MAGDNTERSGSLLSTVTMFIENHLQQGSITFDTLITILSLTCLLTILNRTAFETTVQTRPATGAGNNMQKLLTDLLKSGGGNNTSESLMALLPLLNNPQIKNKLNPATLVSILELLSKFNAEKGDKNEEKDEKTAYKQNPLENKQADVSPPTCATENAPAPSPPPSPAATAAAAATPAEQSVPATQKGMGKYLNWKNSI